MFRINAVIFREGFQPPICKIYGKLNADTKIEAGSRLRLPSEASSCYYAVVSTIQLNMLVQVKSCPLKMFREFFAFKLGCIVYVAG